jgi:hypothetical protein
MEVDTGTFILFLSCLRERIPHTRYLAPLGPSGLVESSATGRRTGNCPSWRIALPVTRMLRLLLPEFSVMCRTHCEHIGR